jgi:prophage maintenance system killer protein
MKLIIECTSAKENIMTLKEAIEIHRQFTSMRKKLKKVIDNPTTSSELQRCVKQAYGNLYSALYDLENSTINKLYTEE